MLHRSRRNGVLKSLAYKTAVVAIALIGTLFVVTELEQNQLLASEISVFGSAATGIRVRITGDSSANVGSAVYSNLAETRVRFQVDSEQRTFNVDELESVEFCGRSGDDFFENMTRIDMEIDGGSGNDTLIGGSGSDLIHGARGDDVIDGREGNDVITGGLGADDINGGDGNDQIFTNRFLFEPDGANNIIDTGAGLDRIDDVFEFAGTEILLYGESNPKLLIIQGDAADNFVRIVELGDQRIRVESDFMADQFFMPGEVDEIVFKGLDGDDTFINNTHIRSTAEGFDGADQLLGGWGADLLNGGDGDDLLQGRGGPDVLGNVNRFFDVLTSQAPIYQSFFATEGSWWTEDGDDNLIGGAGSDRIRGGNGDDRLIAGTGADFLDGGPGSDFHRTTGGNDIANDSGTSINTFVLNGGTVNTGGRVVVIGSALPERVNLAYTFSGSMIDMGGGNDVFFGTGNAINGTHWINMGYGDDFIILDDQRLGQQGKFTIFGDAGNDIIHLTANGDIDTRINGGSGDDIIVVRRHSADIFGGDGDDEITGGLFADTIYGQGGNDTIYGLQGNDFLAGGDGDDVIFGREGDDELLGQQGDDILDGGEGDDILSGGPGNDEEIQ